MPTSLFASGLRGFGRSNPGWLELGDVTLFRSSIQEICTRSALEAAWEHVQAADAADGSLAPSMARFAEDVDGNLDGLASQLAVGSYRPRPLTPVAIPKSGGTRELHIPSARDRVVERALQSRLSPVIDRQLGPTSFAYRAGLGVTDAVRRLIELRDQGWSWVIRTDIDECFPSVDRNRLLLRLEQIMGDADLLDLIAALIRRPVRHGHRVVDRGRGIPQGGALSPLLSNLMLQSVDRHLLDHGHQLVRYADDMAVLARSRAEVDDALAVAHRAAERHGFALGEDKTMITTFDDGFHFLGEDINHRYPAASPHAGRSEPERKVLYVGMQGAGVRMERGRVVVGSKHDNDLLSVPSGHVSRIVLAGSVGFSAGARNWALANGIGVVLLSRRGSYMGSLGSGSTDAALLRSQLGAIDAPDRHLPIARSFVAGKIDNQRTLLQRFVDPDTGPAVATVVEQIELLAGQVPQCTSADELLGTEGMAARYYWDAVAKLLPGGTFQGRVSRPPPDLANAALGYGYAILASDCVAACRMVGLDPSFGLLHREEGRRPALALDLMEEFRPLIVDQVVVELCRRGQLKASHTRVDSARGGVLLTEKGRRALTAGLEDRLLTVAHHPGSGHKVSYRRQIQLQARALVRSIVHGEPYESVRWR